MLQAKYTRYILKFKQPSGTSRGILTEKETWFIKIWDERRPKVFGIGECALFRGLSAEDRPDYEERLHEVCQNIQNFSDLPLEEWSSILFGVETAAQDLVTGGRRLIYPSPLTSEKKAIEINGLIWMGDKETMRERIQEKIDAGFRCLKLKIGAIDFEAELELLHEIRSRFGKEVLELRVDANGAFLPEEALLKLKQLARFDLHSIEQPIRQGQWAEMARLCQHTPIPIALDEELIGIYNTRDRIKLLETIRPQYIILKPALVGGCIKASEWIKLARQSNTGWWITSALESNIGLNTIAQWASYMKVTVPQGLGTGQLYTNNIPSPLVLKGSSLSYDPWEDWDLSVLKNCIWK